MVIGIYGKNYDKSIKHTEEEKRKLREEMQ